VAVAAVEELPEQLQVEAAALAAAAQILAALVVAVSSVKAI
jgi:hypothetical protein